MKHILYDMGNFLLKNIIFCQFNINFWRGTVEGSHNKYFGKIIFLDGWPVPPPPWKIPPK